MDVVLIQMFLMLVQLFCSIPYRPQERLNQCSGEGTVDILHPLGVPLHAEHKRAPVGVKRFDGFDEAVVRNRRGPEPGPRPLHRLVVKRVDVSARGPDDSPKLRALLHRHRVKPLHGIARPVMDEPRLFDIGQKRPPNPTFSTCAPRQMPRTGILRRRA